MHTSTAEDGFTAWMHTAEGATVTIDTTFGARANMPTRLTVLGSDGALESVGDQRITLRTQDGTSEVFTFAAPAEDPHLVPMRGGRWSFATQYATAAPPTANPPSPTASRARG